MRPACSKIPRYPILGYRGFGLYPPAVTRGASSKQDRLLQLMKDVREEAGVTQAELATRLGRPQSFVSKYEVGERGLYFLEVREICLALGLRFSKFVERFEGKG